MIISTVNAIAEVDARQTISGFSVSLLALNIKESKTDTAVNSVAIKNKKAAFGREICFRSRIK